MGQAPYLQGSVHIYVNCQWLATYRLSKFTDDSYNRHHCRLVVVVVACSGGGGGSCLTNRVKLMLLALSQTSPSFTRLHFKLF